MTPTATRATAARRRRAVVVDLEALRLRNERVVAEVAAAPVRHLPPALLEALQDSWGSPQELGLAPSTAPRLRLVAG